MNHVLQTTSRADYFSGLLVLSVDEKSQIQALDREQPVLPMMPGMPNAAPTATSVMAPLRSSQRSISPRDLSSANATSGIAPPSFSTSSSRLTLRCRPTSTYTSSWTITRPTRQRWFEHGSPAGRTTTSTSRQPLHLGSTRSSVGLRNSPASSCGAAFIPPPANWSATSALSSNATTRTQSHTGGPSRPTRSSHP